MFNVAESLVECGAQIRDCDIVLQVDELIFLSAPIRRRAPEGYELGRYIATA